MFARIHEVSSYALALEYNENKVSQGIAQCLYAGNFPLRKDNLSYDLKNYYLSDREDLNLSSNVKAMHIVLSFATDNKLEDDDLEKISKRYMALIRFDKQPFLIYAHNDTAVKHLHIVTSCILQNGKRKNTDRIAARLSVPAVKSINAEFKLIPKNESTALAILASSSPEVIEYGKQPSKNIIERVTAFLLKNYAFNDLSSWNALLSGYRIRASVIQSRIKDGHPGLYYRMLGKDLKAIGCGIPASKLTGSPTIKRLQEYFKNNRQIGMQRSSRLRSLVKMRLLHAGPLSSRFKDSLAMDGIQIRTISLTNGKGAQHVFIDVKNRCALGLDELELGVSVSEKLSKILDPGLHQHEENQKQHLALSSKLKL